MSTTWRTLGAVLATLTLASCSNGISGSSGGSGHGSNGSSGSQGGSSDSSESSGTTHGARPVALPAQIPTPSPDPDDFVDRIDNPYLPLRPGSRWVYASTSTEGDQRIVVAVTDRTKMVAGVKTTVVRDRVTTGDGELVEATYDWFAQDADGNVWYFGEHTTAYRDGKATTGGSWEAGVDGAQAGLVMPADPRPGQAYQQEYRAGVAEDEGKVLAVHATVSGPAGKYDDVVRTADFTPLEPRLMERKSYAPGVGVVQEREVRGGDEVVHLLRFEAGE